MSEKPTKRDDEKTMIEEGTDLTKLSEADIRKFLESHRKTHEDSTESSRLWHNVAAYLSRLDTIRQLEKRKGIKTIIKKAIVGEPIETEEIT